MSMTQNEMNIAISAYEHVQKLCKVSGANIDNVTGALYAMLAHPVVGNERMHGNEMGAVMVEQIEGAGK